MGLPASAGGFWMPERGSSVATGVDQVFGFILWIALFFFVLVVGLMVIFVLRYHRRDEEEVVEASPHHSTSLELTWSIIPLIIVCVIFYLGFKGFMNLNVAPRDAYEVLVTGQKWAWEFTYPNGYADKDLHVPAGATVRLVMRSEDVIHSFYVPDFRIKRDVVPGRYTKAWFTAPAPGEHRILCAEFCGTGHSDMLATVYVHEPADFQAWMAGVAGFIDKLPPAEAGERISQGKGCMVCHTADGKPLVGPTYKGLFGSTRILTDGSEVVADEDYLRESMLDPAAKVAAGFQPVMPTFQGRLSDKEITVLIEYIKSLSE